MYLRIFRHALVLTTLATAPVNATVLLPTDLGDLSREARTIARGRVVDVVSRWTEDRRRIETLVTLAADVYLKGALGATVQFRVPGGRLGRYRNIVVGAPQFTVGQQVIVFLSGSSPAVPHVLGLSQGVFRLAQTGERWVVTPPPVMPVAGGARRIVRGDATRRPMALADFEREVRTLAGTAR